MTDPNVPKPAWFTSTVHGAQEAARRIGQRARSLADLARARPGLTAGIAAAVLLAGAGTAVALGGLPDWEVFERLRARYSERASLRDLAREAREHPSDASAQVALGRAHFQRGHRRAGVRNYARALKLDPKVADEAMAADLVSCFGRREQGRAEALIARYKIAAAAKRLEPLTRAKSYRVRWGAVRTLERIGKASKREYVNAWIADLGSPECDVRRRAAEKLGEAGDRRAVEKLRAAKRHEEETTPWYKKNCIGDRAADAEKRILAKR